MLPKNARLMIRCLRTTACASLLGCGFSVGACGQGLPPQPVGGSAMIDQGLDATVPTTRRPLSTLTVVPEDFSMLKLSPGFLLAMDVYDAPELSAELRLNAAGDINVPMIGVVHAAGLTLTDLSAEISDRLRKSRILNSPHVNLNVVQYAGRSVTVLGEVHNPGRLELLAPHSLAEVLAMVGGETQLAGNTIEVRHEAGTLPARQSIHYSRDRANQMLLGTLIFPGDTITVQRAGVVYVLGGVNRPGGYVMEENGELNVTQALSLAYGTNMQAAVGSMRLIRRVGDGKVKEYSIRYSDITRGKIAPPQLQAEDVIYVPISKTKTILGAGLLATAAQAAIYLH